MICQSLNPCPRPCAGGPSSAPDELVVVTLLVAARGGAKSLGLPGRLAGWRDMAAALTRLGAVPAQELLGVELLWTPEVRA